MKIFITGGTGFIGRHVVTKLLESFENEIIILSRELLPNQQRIRYVQGDLSDLDLLKKHINGCACVLHLAGCKKDPHSFVSTNIEGTENILLACESVSVQKLIYLSSVGVIGETSDQIITEKSKCMPVNGYEKSKYAAELSVRKFAKTFAGKTFILQPSNVFGEFDPEQHLLNLINKIKSNKFMFVGKDTSQFYLNYVYVKEISELILLMMGGQQSGGVFIINTPTLLKEFIYDIKGLINNRLPVKHLPYWPLRIAAVLFDFIPKTILDPPPINSLKLKELTNKKIYSSAALEKEMNWKPKYSIHDALNNLMEHYTEIGIL